MFGELRAHATGLGRHSRLEEPVYAISRCWPLLLRGGAGCWGTTILVTNSSKNYHFEVGGWVGKLVFRYPGSKP